MRRRQGFTLIELLTVVLIIGILTAIALPQYRKSVQRAEAANMLISLKTVFDSAKRYYATSGQWPSSLVGLDTNVRLNQGSSNQSGEYQYEFHTAYRQISVCKLNGAGTCTYLFRAYYKHPSSLVRDVYTCHVNQAKYQAVCDSFGSTKDSLNDVIVE